MLLSRKMQSINVTFGTAYIRTADNVQFHFLVEFAKVVLITITRSSGESPSAWDVVSPMHKHGYSSSVSNYHVSEEQSVLNQSHLLSALLLSSFYIII